MKINRSNREDPRRHFGLHRWGVCCAVALLMLSAPAKLGATLYVPSQYSTIQAAINAAYNGDTILVSPGTYYENLRWENKSLKLNGWGAETTIVDGGHKGRCLYMANVPDTARVRGFTFTHGDTASLVQPGGSLPGV